MPIPPFNTSGVLPPFVGDNPTNPAPMAPFVVDFTELVQRFGASPDRFDLFSDDDAVKRQFAHSGRSHAPQT